MALLRPKNNSFWGKVPTYTVFYVIKKNPTCTPLRPTCLLIISEKSSHLHYSNFLVLHEHFFHGSLVALVF